MTPFYRFLSILDLIWGVFWPPNRPQIYEKHDCSYLFSHIIKKNYFFLQKRKVFWTQPPPNRVQYFKNYNISNQKSIKIFKTCLKFHCLFLLLFCNVWHLFTRFPWKKKRPRAATRRVTMRGVSPPAWLNKSRLATDPKLVTTLKRMGFA